ncbi:MAG: DNA/RNA non-specific endonuclease [Bryobacteraceae bacterium]
MTPLAALLLLAAAQSLLAQPSRFGLPACDSPSSEFADHHYFVLCHDSALRLPSWTAYELLPSALGGHAKRPHSFHADPTLSGPVARNADYRLSGFNRGHLVPAEDFAFSPGAIAATFVLSNTAPQLPSVNQRIWRRIENSVRAVAANSDAVYVFTGPILAGSPTEFAGEVAVPTHFFKVWLAIQGEQKRMYAAIVPNAEISVQSLDDFAVSVDEVERLTGLDFFSNLSQAEQQSLEAAAEHLPSRSR